MYSDVFSVRSQVLHYGLRLPSVLREYCGAAGGVILSSTCTYSYFHPYRVHGSRRKTGANSCWSFVAVVPVKQISVSQIAVPKLQSPNMGPVCLPDSSPMSG